MTTTTVLSEDTATIVGEEGNRFNWGATIAGALIATAVTFFLVTLGSGIGLALVSVPRTGGLAAFLTGGAIYVFAAQAFGFAVGAHVTGRLIGPMVENSKEEEFRAGAHGLAVWALAVVAGLGVLWLTAAAGGIAAANVERPQAAPTAYWADMLLSPAGPGAAPPNAGDKQEAGRVLTADMPRSDDANRNELARLVMQDAGLSRAAAMERVDATEARMRDDANAARKAASIVAIWTALALLFGAIVSVAAAISARWEDDRITFGFAPRR
jgi:hypothetical protein